jgi:hypothetical protein
MPSQWKMGTFLLKPPLFHDPSVAWSGVTKFLNVLMYDTPMIVPSKKYGPVS